MSYASMESLQDRLQLSADALVLSPGNVALVTTLTGALTTRKPTLDPFRNSNSDSATLTSKGKLVINLGTFNNALIFTRGRVTEVFFNRVPRDGGVVYADVFDRMFTGVKSLEITGSQGNDSITLGAGLRFATVHAGVGNDTITGSDGASMLYGGEGDDKIYAGGGDDSLYGEAGDDRLSGDTGNDLLDGGAGKDRVDGGRGRNKLSGGSGTDYLKFREGDKLDQKDRHDYLNEVVG